MARKNLTQSPRAIREGNKEPAEFQKYSFPKPPEAGPLTDPEATTRNNTPGGGKKETMPDFPDKGWPITGL